MPQIFHRSFNVLSKVSIFGGVFVIEAHGTQRDEIEAALRMLSACPRISLLLNKTDTQASEHFGSYGYYKYYSAGGGGNELRATDAA